MIYCSLCDQYGDGSTSDEDVPSPCPKCGTNVHVTVVRGWQPIETAPSDKWLLLYDQGGAYNTPDMTHWIARWCYNDTTGAKGWLDQDDQFVVHNPSHWRPLDSPPEE